jgi:hypothetical protein
MAATTTTTTTNSVRHIILCTRIIFQVVDMFEKLMKKWSTAPFILDLSTWWELYVSNLSRFTLAKDAPVTTESVAGRAADFFL